MRKLVPWLLVLCLIPAIISSCKKDRNVEPQLIEEMWLFDKVVYEEYDSTGVVVESETDSAWTTRDYLALASGGNFDLVQNGQRLNGIYSIENSIMSLTYNQVNSSNQIVSVTTQAPVVEKTSSKFTFYVEDVSTTGKFRATFYMEK